MDRNDFIKILCQEVQSLEGFDLFIFGVGNTAGLFQSCFKNEKLAITAYTDNNQDKWNTQYAGKPVIPPQSMLSYKKPYVLICSAQPKAVRQIAMQLDDMKLPHATVDMYIFRKHQAEVLDVYDALADEQSKLTYASMITRRMLGKPMDTDVLCSNTYFCMPELAVVDSKQVFVDCGAYVGDTLEQYIWKHSGMLSKIYAFEPDAGNYAAMQQRAERLQAEWNLGEDQIILVKAGVSDKSQTLHFKSSRQQAGLSARIDYEDEQSVGVDTIDIIALDDYFTQQKITFLKADIENNELPLLKGATGVIRRDLPYMAICIYHNAMDMYAIPKYIKETFDDQYRLYVRQHECSYSETVLYAIPREA